MLSFDLSAIDVVLLVAVLILFSLYVARKPRASRTESKFESNADKKRTIPLIKKKNSSTKLKTSSSTQPNAESQNCAHEFGYLKDLPRNTPVPDECFGCPKVMQCLFPGD
jgi:cytoskeletal protein RodZ